MSKLTFVLADGTERIVDSGPGESIMVVATRAGIPGIIGECGGVMSCATCHVHVADAWREVVGPPGDHERAVLDFAEDVTDASRLGCQIALRNELDGLTLEVP